MREIIVTKIMLTFIGLAFIYYLCSRGDEKKRWFEIYGKIESIQLIVLLITLLALIAFLVLDLISFSILEFLVGDLSELPRSTIETYFSSLVTVLIGFVGFVAIAFSILYGAHISGNTSSPERKKLGWQIGIWFLFSLYLIFAMIFLFVLPLMNQLHP